MSINEAVYRPWQDYFDELSEEFSGHKKEYIDICPHIQFPIIIEDDESYEYRERFTVRCIVCNKEFSIAIMCN